MRYAFKAPLLRFDHGRGVYHLVNLPFELSDIIDATPLARHGFGSIKVLATVGATTWKTSIFPGSEAFLLLIAKKLIIAEDLVVGDPIEVTLEL